MIHNIKPKYTAWAIIIVFLYFALAIFLSSCSTVKKSQHTVTQKEKVTEVEKKDSANTKAVETQTDTKATETFTKEIDIVFPDAPVIPTDPNDYFTIGGRDSIVGNTKVKTNKPAAVTIKHNGDIELAENPKSVSVKIHQDIIVKDSSTHKETSTGTLSTTEEKKKEVVNTDVKNDVKRTKFLTWWWLLLLLIPAGYFGNKKFKWL